MVHPRWVKIDLWLLSCTLGTMAGDNDEATNAMIASLLAQDQGAYQEEILEEAGQDDSEDEDYGGAKKRKRQSRKGR